MTSFQLQLSELHFLSTLFFSILRSDSHREHCVQGKWPLSKRYFETIVNSSLVSFPSINCVVFWKWLSAYFYVLYLIFQIDVNEPVVLPSGLRLIHVAAFHRQAHTVSQLIALGADVNIVDDEGGYNPLTMAIIGGNISSALTIIKAGANVRAQSQSGRLPM